MPSPVDVPPSKQSGATESSRPKVSDAQELKAGITPLDAAGQLRRRIVEGNNYSRHKKTQFRIAASIVRVSSLVMSSVATVILGLQDLDFWSGLGFSLVALATGATSIETFFNWRSRWILAEEAQYRLYQLMDDLDYIVAKKPTLNFSDIDPLHERYTEIWRVIQADL